MILISVVLCSFDNSLDVMDSRRNCSKQRESCALNRMITEMEPFLPNSKITRGFASKKDETIQNIWFK